MEQNGSSEVKSLQEDENDTTAPTYSVPAIAIAAIEHPAIVKDLGEAVKTFGLNPDYEAIFGAEGPRCIVPLYLRSRDPAALPLISHNAASHNVVLKVTVPKRTGRKRKRGRDTPWEDDITMADYQPYGTNDATRVDGLNLPDARVLRQMMQDNADKYTVEAVGVVRHTHRYRGKV
jgi:general transcription factor 3C polypeptide 5 (transcription factor C subunit 1)